MTDIEDENLTKEDKMLYKIARKRASFKKALFTYAIINVFLWCLWYFSGNREWDFTWGRFPWPLWVTLGWGVGIAFQWSAAYLNPKYDGVEKEFRKLKNKQKQ